MSHAATAQHTLTRNASIPPPPPASAVAELPGQFSLSNHPTDLDLHLFGPVEHYLQKLNQSVDCCALVPDLTVHPNCKPGRSMELHQSVH